MRIIDPAILNVLVANMPPASQRAMHMRNVGENGWGKIAVAVAFTVALWIVTVAFCVVVFLTTNDRVLTYEADMSILLVAFVTLLCWLVRCRIKKEEYENDLEWYGLLQSYFRTCKSLGVHPMNEVTDSVNQVMRNLGKFAEKVVKIQNRNHSELQTKTRLERALKRSTLNSGEEREILREIEGVEIDIAISLLEEDGIRSEIQEMVDEARETFGFHFRWSDDLYRQIFNDAEVKLMLQKRQVRKNVLSKK